MQTPVIVRGIIAAEHQLVRLTTACTSQKLSRTEVWLLSYYSRAVLPFSECKALARILPPTIDEIDAERHDRVAEVLTEAHLDAMICHSASAVLLLTGRGVHNEVRTIQKEEKVVTNPRGSYQLRTLKKHRCLARKVNGPRVHLCPHPVRPQSQVGQF